MSNAYFEYKGKRSSDFGLRIQNALSITTPEQDIELIEVPGKDGDLAMDKKRLKGVPKPFPCTLDVPEGKTVDSISKEIAEWLRTDVGWDKLYFSGYEGYEYEALCYETFDIEETLRTRGKTVINFRLKPYKFRVGSRNAVEMKNGQAIVNTEKRAAKPLIKIAGTGNITIKNNGLDWLVLTAVDGYITIDSARMSVYKDNTSLFSKMNATLDPLFPLLMPGENKLTWTGTVTKLELIPRWEAVV